MSKKDKKIRGVRKEIGVLADHQKVGKRFIPPFLKMDNLVEVRWVDPILPELLWLGLLNARYGLAKGAALAVAISRAALTCKHQESKKFFAATSAYSSLSTVEQAHVVATLKGWGDLEPLRETLAPLAAFYPECPLNFIFESSQPSTDSSNASLSWLKEVLGTLFDRWDKPGTLVQANAVYIAFTSDMLKVAEGISLANFPAVAEFPETEESIRVAGACRGAVTMFFSPPWYEEATPWPGYFWNRGLQIEPCNFSEESSYE